MLPFGVTIPSNVQQRSEMPEGLMNYSVLMKKLVQKNENPHFSFSNFFFRKSCRLWDNVEKYCTAGQATDDNMAHGHCVLDN
jgi:hypothetical protein